MELTQQIEEALLKYCKRLLKTENVYETSAGLCVNLLHYVKLKYPTLYFNPEYPIATEVSETIRKISDSWKHRSEDPIYIVPYSSKDTYMSPKRAYMDIENLWDKNTEYGRLRWDLVKHIVNTLGKKPC